MTRPYAHNSTLRVARAPMKRSPMNKGKGLARLGKRAKAKAGPRAECRRIVRERCGGLCQAGGLVADNRCELRGCDTHEVFTRAQYPNSETRADRAIYVCRFCHGWIGDHPRLACERGLLFSRKHEFGQAYFDAMQRGERPVLGVHAAPIAAGDNSGQSSNHIRKAG